VSTSDDQNSNSSNPKTSPSYLLAIEKAKDDRKIKLWHVRLSFVKNGHSLMKNKLYSEAAISYEKYLKILEMFFDCPSGQLSPELFKESAKTAEMSMVTSTYWDLLRIYDTHDAFAERQKKVAQQLSRFAPLTPLFPDLLKKAQVYQKQARNPDVIKSFITASSKEKPRCFIATSAFEGAQSYEVQYLRCFRDDYLKKTSWGRKFILIYYRYSPEIACALDKHNSLKPSVRALLRAVIKCVSLIF
jgi:hypothetical protein